MREPAIHRDIQHTTRNRRVRRASIGLLAVSTLVAASCGDESDSADTPGTVPAGEPAAGAGPTQPSGTQPANGTEPASSDAMTVAIDVPADGAEVPAEFEVSMTPSVEVGEPETGLHHIHLYYDGNTNEGEYGIVYGSTFTVSGLAPGEHTIEAVIANPDHSLTDARSAPITVNVMEGGASESGGAPTTFDYDY